MAEFKIWDLWLFPVSGALSAILGMYACNKGNVKIIILATFLKLFFFGWHSTFKFKKYKDFILYIR